MKTPAEFYKGKTVQLGVGDETGGGFDTDMRAAAASSANNPRQSDAPTICELLTSENEKRAINVLIAAEAIGRPSTRWAWRRHAAT